MYKGNITTATAVTSTQNIPFTSIWNTNNNTSYSATDNAVQFFRRGKYNVNVTLNVTGSTPTTLGAQLLANGVAISESLVQTDITATTGIATLNIADTINVEPVATTGYAELSVRLTGNATISNGVITVEKVC